MAVGLALVGAGWIAGWLLFARAPWLRTVAMAEPNVAVDVVIVAHDEQARLPTLLAALGRQSYLAQRVIVVDRGSSDRTAELAHAARAMVVAPGPVPAGDTPTGWARRQGAAAAGGDVLVFLDPGTEPAPEFLRRAVSEQLRLGGLLSIQPYRRMRRIRERLVAFVDLVTAMAVGGMDASRAGGRVTGAFAACTVCNRADYVAVAGNVELRSIPGYPALARRFAGAGRTVHTRLGWGAIELHPQSEPGRARVGARAENLLAGLRTTPVARAAAIALWGVALATAAVELGLAPDGRVFGAVLYAACVVQLAVFLRRIGNYGWVTGVLYPLSLLAFVGALLWALLRRGATRAR
jgi:4,4'-diaponeurosporenoate glycosyltransferase